MQKNYSTNKVKSTNINKDKNSGGSRTTNRKANKNTDRSANSMASSAKRKHNTADSKKRFLYLIPVITWMIFIFYIIIVRSVGSENLASVVHKSLFY